MQVNVKAALDDHLQIHPPPTHDAVPLRVRSLFDDALQLRHLLKRQPRLRPGMGSIVQTSEALGIVTMNPIAQGLPVHASVTCCLFTPMPLQHQRQSEHPPRRCSIPAAFGLLSQVAGTQLQPHDRHGHRSLPRPDITGTSTPPHRRWLQNGDRSETRAVGISLDEGDVLRGGLARVLVDGFAGDPVEIADLGPVLALADVAPQLEGLPEGEPVR